jgi:hypothetical protein
VRPVLWLAVLLMLLAPGAVSAGSSQETLDTAANLYASAAYEESLAMLERLPTADLPVEDRVAIEHYRMLCLLALGRTADAEGVIVSLLDAHPSYRLSEHEASPRVLRVFLDTRRRALPGVVDRRYQQAKRLYDEGRYSQAAMAFAVVRSLLADADLAAAEGRVADLGQLAAGFEELSRAALVAEERRAAEAAAANARAAAEAARRAEDVARVGPPGRAADPPPPGDPPDGVYDAADPGVVAPEVVRQEIRWWRGRLPEPPDGSPLGTIQVVIDESGTVIASAIVASVSVFYDAMLLESARSWRYTPATKNGRPVKFRRVFAAASGH